MATKKTAKKVTKKTAVKKTAAPKPEKGKYSVVVETGGETYTASNVSNISEALLGFGIKFTNTKIEITVSKGKASVEKSYFKAQGLRILKNGMASRYFARNVEKALDS